jgi:RsiW-degrading membrane proteinase PrsW (M82 family)
MKKFRRIALNILLPPALAVALLIGAISLVALEMPDWRLGTAALLYAYVFASIPSVTHALTMEFFYRHGLHPKEKKAVVISTLSGAVSGVLVIVCAALVFRAFSDLASAFFIYPTLGAATGAVTAIVIMALTKKNA